MNAPATTATRLPGSSDDYAIKHNCRLVGVLLAPLPGLDDRFCYAPNDGEAVYFADQSAALAHVGIGSAEAVTA